MDEELKRTVEAILFAAARKLELSEIANLCRRSEQDVLAVLIEWKAQLDSADSPTMLLQDNTAWKLTIREKYVSIIKKVVTKTEMPKGHLETLAIVAYKVPVLQSKVVKIRTNKAYDHLAQLENSGFITREKQGRSKLIKLTPKFFEYFDIDSSKLKHKFSSAGDVEKAIEAKEKEIEDIGVLVRKKTEEQLRKPQIALQPDQGPPKKLETYPAVQPVEDMLPSGVEVFMEKLDNLEVYDVPPEAIPPEERPVEVHKKKKPAKKRAPEAVNVEKAPEVAEVPAPVPEVVPEVAKVPKLHKEKKVKEEKPVQPEIPVQEKPVSLSPAEKVVKEAAEKAAGLKGKAFEEGKGLFPEGVPPEVEAKIEERIKRILSGEDPENK